MVINYNILSFDANNFTFEVLNTWAIAAFPGCDGNYICTWSPDGDGLLYGFYESDPGLEGEKLIYIPTFSSLPLDFSSFISPSATTIQWLKED